MKLMLKRFSVVLLACSLFFIIIPSFAAAANICFTWTKNAVPTSQTANGVVGYKIYRNPTTPTEFVFPSFLQDDACNDSANPTKCTACVPDINDGLNHRYAATAYNATGESGFSTPADVVVQGNKGVVSAIEQNPTVPGTFLHVLVPIEQAQ